MKNFTKKDFIYLWIIILSFLGVVFLLSNTMYLYGSQLDWYAQHISIAEYFRTLFYSTKDLFPDFAMNIGGGQNIYNFSYYGLYSPIVLVSYLFPKISMTKYMITTTILSVEISAVLLYLFFRKKYSSEASFGATFLYIMASPILMHSHRHIMFINYLPFLVLGLFGVDKKLEENKGWLLSLSCFLMIVTSYYFSIGGLVSLVIYGIYKYLKNTNKVTVKHFFKTGINFLLPIMIAVLGSALLTIPTFASLLFNRADSNVTIALKDLLLPKINTSYAIYDSYGLGLTMIVFPALIHLFTKKKEDIFLGSILSFFILFPLGNYILNGTMYIDAKTLIPFLPLYTFAILKFIEDCLNKTLKIKVVLPIFILILVLIVMDGYKTNLLLLDTLVLFLAICIYYLCKKKIVFLLPILTVGLLSSYFVSKSDHLELKYTTESQETEIKDSINTITDSDDSFYRISTDFAISNTPNKVYENSKYYNSTIYSSISNQIYNKFYFDIMNNNIPSRNRALTVTTGNSLFLMLTNNKYIISRNKPLQGYKLVETKEGINIYKNEEVLPLAFATSNVISYEDFDKLTAQVKQEALLKMIVADTTSKNNFVSSTIRNDLDWDAIFTNEKITKEEDGSYNIYTKDNLKIEYELPEKYKNKIIFIRFKMNRISSCSEGDLAIKINNMKNKLTCKSWKYYNKNEVFDYVLAEKDIDHLTISFAKGNYNISDLEVYTLDYASIETVKNNVDALEIDTSKTKGDFIEGKINVTQDGYFVASIPYDKGFKILVDNKEVEYELVDEAFIGFPITKGKHMVKIEYKAPLKNISLLVSLVGISTFALVTFLESRRKI